MRGGVGTAEEHLDTETETEARVSTLTVGALLNPLHLPRRLLGAGETTLAAVQLLPRLPALMIARLDSMERTLLEVKAGIDSVEHTLGPQAERVGDIEAAVHRIEERMEGLQGELQDATEHLPNHGSGGGPIDRMRGALKGSP
jgi:hypothetical protein